jgi:hypothetical protein
MRNPVHDPLHPYESQLLEEFLAAQRRLAPAAPGARRAHPARNRVALAGGCAAVAVAAAATVAGLTAHGTGSAAALRPAGKITTQLADALQASATDVLYDQEVQSSPGFTLTLHQWLSPWDPRPGQAVAQRIEYFQHCTNCSDSGLIQDLGQTGTMPAGATASTQFPWGTTVTTTGQSTDVRYPYRQWTSQKSVQVSFSLPLTPAQIQHEITDGHAGVVGHAIIDGVQTVQLAISGFDGSGSRGDIWVSTTTHLPVRSIVSAHGGTVQNTYQFLPATPANLAQTRPVIPTGFTNNPALG